MNISSVHPRAPSTGPQGMCTQGVLQCVRNLCTQNTTTVNIYTPNRYKSTLHLKITICVFHFPFTSLFYPKATPSLNTRNRKNRHWKKKAAGWKTESERSPVLWKRYFLPRDWMRLEWRKEAKGYFVMKRKMFSKFEEGMKLPSGKRKNWAGTNIPKYSSRRTLSESRFMTARNRNGLWLFQKKKNLLKGCREITEGPGNPENQALTWSGERNKWGWKCSGWRDCPCGVWEPKVRGGDGREVLLWTERPPTPPPQCKSSSSSVCSSPASSLYSSSHSAAGPLISPISPQPLAPARVAPLLRLTYTWKQGLAGFLAPASVVGDFKWEEWPGFVPVVVDPDLHACTAEGTWSLLPRPAQVGDWGHIRSDFPEAAKSCWDSSLRSDQDYRMKGTFWT